HRPRRRAARRPLRLRRLRPVVVLVRAAARREATDVRPLAVALLEAFLGRVGLVVVVVVLVLLRDAEVDERPRPQIAQAHRGNRNAAGGRAPLSERGRSRRARTW